jgi:hypothetical protein
LTGDNNYYLIHFLHSYNMHVGVLPVFFLVLTLLLHQQKTSYLLVEGLS